MIYEKAMELVSALRSGKYLQGKDFLRKDEDHYCCLGVACEISGVSKFKLNEYDKYVYDGYYGHLPDPVMAYFGFTDRFGGRDDTCIIIDKREYKDLSAANDEGVSFAKIADYIENNWEQL